MTELRYYKHPVIDCSDFDSFVKEVYGKEYSTVNSLVEVQGHYTYELIDLPQWKYDQNEENEWAEPYDGTTFEEWLKMDYPSCYNNGPDIHVMVDQLQKDGYDVPDRFLVLVDW